MRDVEGGGHVCATGEINNDPGSASNSRGTTENSASSDAVPM